MSSTVSMWLGISFVLLGVIATILQAWLWRFPMVPDPGGPDPHGKSSAPRAWTNVHRAVGAAFLVIYVLMMVEMVPRLWEYQVELPARTVMHAVMGITIGFLLVIKISIIRWFQHFGKSLPIIGTLIMLCTIILATLSVPFALRAYDFGSATTPQNLERVATLLEPLNLTPPAKELATAEALGHGRDVLTTKCVVCHDLRTILRRPYPPEGWYDVVVRMADKPQIDRALEERDLAPVTAYLVAITPDIQESLKKKRAEEQRRAEAVAPDEVEPVVVAVEPRTPAPVVAIAEPQTVPSVAVEPATRAPAIGGPAKSETPEPVKPIAPEPVQPIAPEPVQPIAPEPPKKKPGLFDTPEAVAKAKATYVKECTPCHTLKDVDEAAPQDYAGWRKIVRRMVAENDAEISRADQDLITAYLARTKGGKPKPKP